MFCPALPGKTMAHVLNEVESSFQSDKTCQAVC